MKSEIVVFLFVPYFVKYKILL